MPTGNFLAWMGENAFYIYDGTVKYHAMADYVFDNLNVPGKGACWGGHNSNFNEIWWGFPSGDTRPHNKYVIWNYAQNVWSIGELDRGCWIDQVCLIILSLLIQADLFTNTNQLYLVIHLILMVDHLFVCI